MGNKTNGLVEQKKKMFPGVREIHNKLLYDIDASIEGSFYLPSLQNISDK